MPSAVTLPRLLLVAALGAVPVLSVACAKRQPVGGSASASSATKLPPASPSALEAYRAERAGQLSEARPVGPRLGLVPGEGVGPIRFGATVATIERLMQAPCDVVTEQRCRYFAQAIDFELKDGKMVRATAHRRGRPAGKDKTGKDRVFGAFNGGIPPDLAARRPDGVAFGMHAPGAQMGVGKPVRVEKVTAKNAFGTVERDYYDGLILEYDRLPLEVARVPIVGGIVILPSDKPRAGVAKPGASAAPSGGQPAKTE